MAPTGSHLVPRDSNNCSGSLSGGAIAGIVIGSIFGTLLLIWVWKFLQLGTWSSDDLSDVGYRPPITRTAAGDERRRRRRPSNVDYYVEKPRSSSSRRYRDEVRRPAKVYLS